MGSGDSGDNRSMLENCRSAIRTSPDGCGNAPHADRSGAESRRLCPISGNEFSEGMEFCPIRALHEAGASGTESGESGAEDAVKPTPEQPVQRFEHYELVRGEDGKPIELIRGAMGVT